MARRRPEPPTVNPARGAALVVVAVVVGLFLLRNGLDTSEAVTNSGRPAAQGSTTTEKGVGTTTTTVASRKPAQVPVVVLNDSGVGGVAGKYSDALAAAGYNLTNPKGANADAPGDAPVTAIYFAPGFKVEAGAVAKVIGAPATVVPSPLPTTPPGPTASANVVVVIGTDLANATPPTVATAGSSTTTTAN